MVDLFAGPGGWSEGARMLGITDVGIEWDAAACADDSLPVCTYCKDALAELTP